ncbi:hypothetical protein [uncultured Streptomyces sp.]|uniref:hypothetical protein n=1 Tax=uncultured Streptomyces sp. TaxID=174707 RepID=UPI00262D48D6|nr:hypothetical protein [uncultured Streptomyces sp.]
MVRVGFLTPGASGVRTVEYREQSCSRTQNWIATSLAALNVSLAEALADAASVGSAQWQENFLSQVTERA